MDVLNDFDKIRDFTLNRSGTEAYFTIQSQTEEISVIVLSIKENNTWKQPEIASFSGKYKDLEPFFSPDGLRLYFVSNRPLLDSITVAKDFDIWYVERSNPQTGWSQPINLGSPINSEHNEFYPSLAENGNLYFTSDGPEAVGEDDIFFSAFQNGSYAKPVPLDENINTAGYEYNAYISKEDSYLIFGGYNRDDGQGSGDMYISFKDKAGKWSQAKPLPQPINSKYMDYCPFMDEENRILYFTSRRTKKPTEPFNTMDSLQRFLNAYENGNSRLYRATLDIEGLK
ncbi:MAG: hypothetical protein R2819_11890 [Allomuricauda sp.]